MSVKIGSILYGLRYNNRVVALRFSTSEHKCYVDIDINSFIKLGLRDRLVDDIRGVGAVKELVEHGDLLTTNDELNGTARVIDGSENINILLEALKQVLKRSGYKKDIRQFQPLFEKYGVIPPIPKSNSMFGDVEPTIRANGSLGFIQSQRDGEEQYIIALEARLTNPRTGNKTVEKFVGNVPAVDSETAKKIAYAYILDEYNCGIGDVAIRKIEKDTKLKFLGKPANFKTLKPRNDFVSIGKVKELAERKTGKKLKLTYPNPRDNIRVVIVPEGIGIEKVNVHESADGSITFSCLTSDGVDLGGDNVVTALFLSELTATSHEYLLSIEGIRNGVLIIDGELPTAEDIEFLMSK